MNAPTSTSTLTPLSGTCSKTRFLFAQNRISSLFGRDRFAHQKKPNSVLLTSSIRRCRGLAEKSWTPGKPKEESGYLGALAVCKQWDHRQDQILALWDYLPMSIAKFPDHAVVITSRVDGINAWDFHVLENERRK